MVAWCNIPDMLRDQGPRKGTFLIMHVMDAPYPQTLFGPPKRVQKGVQKRSKIGDFRGSNHAISWIWRSETTQVVFMTCQI